jgi:hypothetical protein
VSTLRGKMDFGNENFSFEFSLENITLLCSLKTAEDDIEYNRQEIVGALCNRKCEHFFYDALSDLDWILKCADDGELAHWACTHLLTTENPAKFKKILCHSPRDVAIQTLMDNAYSDCEFCFCNFGL